MKRSSLRLILTAGCILGLGFLIVSSLFSSGSNTNDERVTAMVHQGQIEGGKAMDSTPDLKQQVKEGDETLLGGSPE